MGPGPTISTTNLEHTQNIWHGFSKTLKVGFFLSDISVEISTTETQNNRNVLYEIWQ